MTPTDLAIDRYPAASDPDRLLKTPAEEVHLALRADPRTPAWLDPGFATVYIATNEANAFVRVGAADKFRKRFLSLKVNSPVLIEVFHFLHVVGKDVAQLIQQDVQDKLVPVLRHGAWHAADPEEAADYLGRATKRIAKRFWTEDERRQIGKIAARIYARRGV